ncbi:MAG: DciA family protein [Candidatus Spechtbacterales bacterium]
MLISIRSYIAKFSKRPDINQNLEEQILKSQWQDIVSSVNKSARDKSQALYINKSGDLVVKVRNHLWLQELTFYKEEIRKKLTKTSSVKSIKLII